MTTRHGLISGIGVGGVSRRGVIAMEEFDALRGDAPAGEEEVAVAEGMPRRGKSN